MCKDQKNISAIILSAGKSERMGWPKFALKFDSKLTFLEKITNEYYSFGCKEIIVVINTKNAALLREYKLELRNNVKIVVNEHPEWERFYSLKLGAMELASPSAVFISNIDNPFVSNSLLEALKNNSKSIDYSCLSYSGKGGHPFYLSERAISDLKAEKQDQLHLKEFLGRYEKRLINTNDEKVLRNINTPEDYSKYFGREIEER